ncbi:terminal uridylyltransferase Tailor-like isoform X1 [Topomyia yanbarensis]|uniref:terminal uridylyltransferase Tailor-like isoform X1 n=1 Tax=Topomyia yanbarensis TaxID=2498891 RepID=UPI00273CD4A4|nr:terminal uridylyltransferase Tailor-like isoform X1 [Topomyia yanbarensis]
MQELFLMNWEISSLTQKLQSCANSCSIIDLKTVSFLNQLIDTVAAILTNKSLIPQDEWDSKDRAIFNNYTFSRSINCKHCGRSVKMTKPSLMKHLKEEHKSLPELTNKFLDSLERYANSAYAAYESEQLQATDLTSKKSSKIKSGIADDNNASSNQQQKSKASSKEINKTQVTSKTNSLKTRRKKKPQPSEPHHTNEDKQKQKSPTRVVELTSTKIRQNGITNVNKTSSNKQQIAEPSSKEINKTQVTSKTRRKKKPQPNEPHHTNEDKQKQKSPTRAAELTSTKIRQNGITNVNKTSSNKQQIAEPSTILLNGPQATDNKCYVPVKASNNKKSQPAEPRQTNENKIKRKPRRRMPMRDDNCLEVGCFPQYDVGLTKKLTKFLGTKPMTFLEDRMAGCIEVINSPAHTKIAQSLVDLLKLNFPKVKVYPFGSRVAGLGDSASDLDVFLDLYNCFDGAKYSKVEQEVFVGLVHRKLQKSNDWTSLVPIINARTPILRAWNTVEKIDCDISFANGLSYCNTMLIKYMFELQPICYRVALYVKEWARLSNIEGLNSYTLNLLTIYYFQVQKLLPSVYDLQKDSTERCYIKSWRSDFERLTLDELDIPLVTESALETYLVGLFVFYGMRFCFETSVVCTYLGWAPQKKDFDPKVKEIPWQMETLLDYYEDDNSEKLAYTKPIVVQDPFDLIHNVAKGLCPLDASKLRHYFMKSAQLLDEKFTHLSNGNK